LQKAIWKKLSRDLDRGSRFMAWVATGSLLIPEPTLSKGVAVIAGVGAAGMYFFSGEAAAWIEDPPDPHYTVVAVPAVHLARPLTAGSGVTSAEASALNAVMGNLAQAGAYAQAMTTAANRAAGAATAGSSMWLGRQDSALGQDSSREAALVRAQPALYAQLQHAITAAGARLTVTPADVRRAQHTAGLGRLDRAIVVTLTQLGVQPGSASQLAADLLRPDLSSPIAFPGFLTSAAWSSDAALSATGWQQLAGRLCAASVVPRGLQLWINGDHYRRYSGSAFVLPPIEQRLGTPIHLEARWNGAPLDGRYTVRMSNGDVPDCTDLRVCTGWLTPYCTNGTVCRRDDLRRLQDGRVHRGRGYYAELWQTTPPRLLENTLSKQGTPYVTWCLPLVEPCA
jgi:hypothetical protein